MATNLSRVASEFDPFPGGRRELIRPRDAVSSGVVYVAVPGPKGDPGPAGPQGEKGDPGAGVVVYVHEQATPSDLWTIAHNLNSSTPDINVYTTGGVLIETPEAVVLSANVLELRFSAPFSGTAHLS